MPVVGLLDPRSSSDAPVDILRAFRQDLREAGYVEGEKRLNTAGRTIKSIDCRRWRAT
jgi:hypothetical protein